jgi:hypothetical protein
MDAVLLQDCGEIGLGLVILEGAVTEHAGTVAGRCQCLVPFGDAQCERLGVVFADAGVEAGQE